MPCSQDHFIPILDEIDQRAKEAEAREALRKRRGGPRPGSGPPKGNLNALKHGRFSRRHKIILEAILEVPEAREALIGVMKRNRQRQKQAELEAAYILMRWLATNNPQFLPAALDQAAANLETSPLSRGGAGGGAAWRVGRRLLPSGAVYWRRPLADPAPISISWSASSFTLLPLRTQRKTPASRRARSSPFGR